MTLILLDHALGPETTRRLLAMGLRPGAQVEVLSATSGGGRVLGVAGARIAIGSELARHLTVAHAA